MGVSIVFPFLSMPEASSLCRAKTSVVCKDFINTLIFVIIVSVVLS